MSSHTSSRYGTVAMSLHWLIALGILMNIVLGYLMDDKALLGSLQRFTLFQLHKSVGLTVLVLSIVRLVWRLTHPVPPLAAHLKPWERLSAHIVHWAFYVLIIAVPFIGWAAVSAAPIGLPTVWFSTFTVPHLPYLPTLPRAEKIPLADTIDGTHAFLAYSMLALIVLHVAGAMKHQWLDKDGELSRMIPWIRARVPPME